MSSTTIVLGKVLGLYLVAIALGMLVNRRRTLETLDAMAHSGPWMLFSGMVATAAGLAVVTGHNDWSSVLAAVVTLIGWAALLKGLALLLVPPERMATAYKNALGFERFFYVWMVVVLAVGLWVSAMAFGA